jgi:hypothetical protein
MCVPDWLPSFCRPQDLSRYDVLQAYRLPAAHLWWIFGYFVWIPLSYSQIYLWLMSVSVSSVLSPLSNVTLQKFVAWCVVCVTSTIDQFFRSIAAVRGRTWFCNIPIMSASSKTSHFDGQNLNWPHSKSVFICFICCVVIVGKIASLSVTGPHMTSHVTMPFAIHSFSSFSTKISFRLRQFRCKWVTPFNQMSRG